VLQLITTGNDASVAASNCCGIITCAGTAVTLLYNATGSEAENTCPGPGACAAAAVIDTYLSRRNGGGFECEMEPTVTWNGWLARGSDPNGVLGIV
jgi:hypothetical protein